MIGQLEVVTFPGVIGVKVNGRFSSAPFRRGGVLSVRREVIAERCQQERAKPTLGPVDLL